jgi:hypothetical protein
VAVSLTLLQIVVAPAEPAMSNFCFVLSSIFYFYRIDIKFINESHLSLSSMNVVSKGLIKVTKGLITLTPEIDCDQTAMNLPPITSAVFLIAKQFW